MDDELLRAQIKFPAGSKILVRGRGPLRFVVVRVYRSPGGYLWVEHTDPEPWFLANTTAVRLDEIALAPTPPGDLLAAEQGRIASDPRGATEGSDLPVHGSTTGRGLILGHESDR